MRDYIAYCGLDCETCQARLATVRNDETLRRQVAAAWSELNGLLIRPEEICCEGCRIDGAKTPYCESLCPIRRCAMGKGLYSCGRCAEMERCEKLGAVLHNNAQAREELRRDAD